MNHWFVSAGCFAAAALFNAASGRDPDVLLILAVVALATGSIISRIDQTKNAR